MKSTTADCSQLSAECECVSRNKRPPCTCISDNSKMNARCKTALSHSLSLRTVLCFPEFDKSINDPISNSGFEYSTNFLHLFRQSALSRSPTSSSQSSSVRQDGYLLLRRGWHTHPPLPFLCQLCFHCFCYCCFCCPWLEVLRGALCAFLVLAVVEQLHQSFRSRVPNPVFQTVPVQVAVEQAEAATSNRCYCYILSRQLLDAGGARGCHPFALQAMSLALRRLHSPFP